jgi:hypothetical protein
MGGKHGFSASALLRVDDDGLHHSSMQDCKMPLFIAILLSLMQEVFETHQRAGWG